MQGHTNFRLISVLNACGLRCLCNKRVASGNPPSRVSGGNALLATTLVLSVSDYRCNVIRATRFIFSKGHSSFIRHDMGYKFVSITAYIS